MALEVPRTTRNVYLCEICDSPMVSNMQQLKMYLDDKIIKFGFLKERYAHTKNFACILRYTSLNL